MCTRAGVSFTSLCILEDVFMVYDVCIPNTILAKYATTVPRPQQVPALNGSKDLQVRRTAREGAVWGYLICAVRCGARVLPACPGLSQGRLGCQVSDWPCVAGRAAAAQVVGMWPEPYCWPDPAGQVCYNGTVHMVSG